MIHTGQGIPGLTKGERTSIYEQPDVFYLIHPAMTWEVALPLLTGIVMYCGASHSRADKVKVAYEGPALTPEQAQTRLAELRQQNDNIRLRKGLQPRRRESVSGQIVK